GVDARGRLTWRQHVADVIALDPALGDAIVVVPGETHVTALDRATGEQRWRQPVQRWTAGIAVWNGTAYVSDGTGVMRAFDAASGATRWSVSDPGALDGAP